MATRLRRRAFCCAVAAADQRAVVFADAGPTYTSCATLNYVLRQADEADADAVLMESGVYNMTYGVDLVISGYAYDAAYGNESVLVFDFEAAAMWNRTSFVRIVDSHNITFRHLKFKGVGAEQDNAWNLDAVIAIENSSGTVFDGVVFEHFQVTNSV